MPSQGRSSQSPLVSTRRAALISIAVFVDRARAASAWRWSRSSLDTSALASAARSAAKSFAPSDLKPVYADDPER